MRKVKEQFFCIEEKKNYNAGDDYKGKRTDIEHVLEPEKKVTKQHPKTKKGAIEKKQKK